MTGPNVEFAHQRRCSVLKSSGRGGENFAWQMSPPGRLFPGADPPRGDFSGGRSYDRKPGLKINAESLY